MAYKLNKTDGTLLTELVDGQIDTTSCDLTLIGRNYVGFGEAFNENLIKLLENFASTSPPATPIVGQVWYDRSEARLKVYDGSGFKASGPIISNTQPDMVAGDIWINNSTNQLHFYDGTGDPILVGPAYTDAQGTSGYVVDTVRGKDGQDRTVVKLLIANTPVALLSNINFEPSLSEQSRLRITGRILKGYNIIDSDNFVFYGVSNAAESLITNDLDSNGNRIRKSASQFLFSDANSTTTGTIFIQNSNGLTIGRTGEARFQATDEVTSIILTGKDDKFRVNMLGDSEYDAFVLTSNNRRAGINMDLGSVPRATLDVNGDTIIRGNLTVEGNQTVLETSTLTVDDYNLELGHADTVITLNSPMNATIAALLTENELITESNTNAQGRFKSISDDLLTLYLEPVSGSFSEGLSNRLTAASAGILLREEPIGTEAYVASAVQRSDVTANGAGVIIKGTPAVSNEYDKYLKWINNAYDDQWESSENFALAEDKAFKIIDRVSNNPRVMIEQTSAPDTYFELGVNIEVASGLRDVGILDRVRVGEPGTTRILIDEVTAYGATLPTIQAPIDGLRIDSADTITVTNAGNDVKITGVATTNYTTGALSDAANKDYVDTQMESNTVALALDVTDMPQTGFNSLNEQIIDILDFLHPAAEKRLNTFARVHTTSFRGQVSNIDISNTISTTKIGADFSDINTIEPYGTPPTNGGSANQQLVQDIGFTGTTSGDVTLKADDGGSPAQTTRVKRFYKVIDNGGTYEWQASATGPNGETP